MYKRNKTILHFCNITVWLRIKNENKYIFSEHNSDGKAITMEKKNKYFQLLTGGDEQEEWMNIFFHTYHVCITWNAP